MTSPTNPKLLPIYVSIALKHCGFYLPEEDYIKNNVINKLVGFVNLVEKWGNSFNLTSSPNFSSWWVHFIDSLILAKYLSLLHVKQSVDIGSGGGFPAIPCAILNRQTHFTLYENDYNKASFLRQVLVDCRLDNITLAKDWSKRDKSFPLVTSKAFLTLNDFVVKLQDFLAPGGTGFIFNHHSFDYLSNNSVIIPDFLIKSRVNYFVPSFPCLTNSSLASVNFSESSKKLSLDSPLNCRSILLLKR